MKKKKPKTRAYGNLRHKRELKNKAKLYRLAQKIKHEIDLNKGTVVSSVRREV